MVYRFLTPTYITGWSIYLHWLTSPGHQQPWHLCHGADDLVKSGAAIVLNCMYFFQNIPISTPEQLTSLADFFSLFMAFKGNKNLPMWDCICSFRDDRSRSRERDRRRRSRSRERRRRSRSPRERKPRRSRSRERRRDRDEEGEMGNPGKLNSWAPRINIG